MDRTNPALQDVRRRRRTLMALLLALSLGSVGAGAFSLAVFTDTAASDGGFSTGTVDIATSPSTLFTVTDMLPGDSTSATLTVANSGTTDLRYAMTSVSTNADSKDLRSQLQVDIKAGSCPGAGASLYNGALGASSAAFGDTTQGAQAGDRVLSGGASEDLCFTVSLPLATGNAYQGATTSATFSFEGEQTANNP